MRHDRRNHAVAGAEQRPARRARGPHDRRGPPLRPRQTSAEVTVDAEQLGKSTLAGSIFEIAGQLHGFWRGLPHEPRRALADLIVAHGQLIELVHGMLTGGELWTVPGRASELVDQAANPATIIHNAEVSTFGVSQ